MKKPLQECPKCGRSTAEAVCIEEYTFESGTAVLICQCGYFRDTTLASVFVLVLLLTFIALQK